MTEYLVAKLNELHSRLNQVGMPADFYERIEAEMLRIERTLGLS